jgi:hypothetical protein
LGKRRNYIQARLKREKSCGTRQGKRGKERKLERTDISIACRKKERI